MRALARMLGACLLLAYASSSGSAQAPEAVERGRALYTLGTSAGDRAVTARIFGGERVPAATLPCVQCHRPDGSGGVEGGRGVPRLTRATLAMPRESRGGGERARPAYDRDTLARAIRDGKDAAGRAFDELMPRYEMDERDLADLLAYLAVLGDEPAPGCDERRVRVATLLPLSGADAARGAALRLVLEAALARWNEAGGLHGRALELVAADCGSTSAAARAAAEALLAGGVLCFLAPAGPGSEPALLRELAARGVPVVGPLGITPEATDPGPVFWLLASFADQGRARARHLAAAGGRCGFLDDGTPAARALRAACERELGEAHTARGERSELVALRPERLVCLGSAAWLERELAALSTTDWRPRLALASVLLDGSPRLAGFAVDLVAPALGPGWSAGGERFDALLAELAPRLPEAGAGAPLLRAAYAATELLAHGLRAAGRDLSRERLTAALSEVRRLETGVMPPLTFGRTLRVGTHASVVVSYAADGALDDVRLVEPAPAGLAPDAAEARR